MIVESLLPEMQMKSALPDEIKRLRDENGLLRHQLHSVLEQVDPDSAPLERDGLLSLTADIQDALLSSIKTNPEEMFVWESNVGHGWKVVEARRDKYGCPYNDYHVLIDGTTYNNAVDFASKFKGMDAMRVNCMTRTIGLNL